LEIVGSALKGFMVLTGRFLSVLGFSSIRETAFFGGGGGVGSGAGTALVAGAGFPLPPKDGAVIARGGVLLGAGAAEDIEFRVPAIAEHAAFFGGGWRFVDDGAGDEGSDVGEVGEGGFERSS
jgi:hypothetical protein